MSIKYTTYFLLTKAESIVLCIPLPTESIVYCIPLSKESIVYHWQLKSTTSWCVLRGIVIRGLTLGGYHIGSTIR